jgi:hypothetical protein
MILGVTVASRYAEAMLLRGRRRTVSFVVVEGASDSRLYRQVLDATASHILWLNGKEEALNLIQRFRDTSVPGTLSVIDADLERLFGRARQGPNIIWTSETDMETTVIYSDAYFRVIPNLPSYDTMKRNRDRLFAACVPVGALRALSQRERWALDFKELSFRSFIDTAAVTCDIEALCEEVLLKNPAHSLSVDELVVQLRGFIATLPDTKLVYQGHDLCRLLKMCNMRLFSGRDLGFDRVAEKYGAPDFDQTSTCMEIRVWEAGNTPFAVLAVQPIVAAALPTV